MKNFRKLAIEKFGSQIFSKKLLSDLHDIFEGIYKLFLETILDHLFQTNDASMKNFLFGGSSCNML